MTSLESWPDAAISRSLQREDEDAEEKERTASPKSAEDAEVAEQII